MEVRKILEILITVLRYIGGIEVADACGILSTTIVCIIAGYIALDEMTSCIDRRVHMAGRSGVSGVIIICERIMFICCAHLFFQMLSILAPKM